jgi:hypothetical protein
MAIKIRENPKIKGIKVLYSEHEISQFGNFRNINIEIYSQNSKRSFSPGEIPVFT